MPLNLKVGGLARLSSCDWPGELAATIFCQGCAWNCPYCHNPGLREIGKEGELSWENVRDFLLSRRGLLDGVVFSGGEPTLQSALPDAVEEVRSLGFRVGLHTTGMLPERFAALLPLLDWVGFDVKAPFERYAEITRIPGSGAQALKSLPSLLASGVAYEVRTTFHPLLLDSDAMAAIKASLLDLGVINFVVQRYRAIEGHPPELLAPAVFELPAGFSGGFQRFEFRR